jgi:chromosome partitioning protein
MEVIVFASRKGGSGKSTLAAHISAHASRPPRRNMIIDCDSQGSLSLWHKLRGTGDPTLMNGTRGVSEIIKKATEDGYDWAFIDTPPNMSAVVADAIRHATLVVIPARLAVFDLAAIKETIELARHLRKPYAVVINAAPARRDNTESPSVTETRQAIAALHIPVWAGQITNRANYALALAAGEGAKEYDAQSQAAAEVARLWLAIERSVKAIRGAYQTAGAMHRAA